jgi:hypothetical protein
MKEFKVETIVVDSDLKVTTYPLDHPAVREVVRLCDKYMLRNWRPEIRDTSLIALISNATYACIVKVQFLSAEIYLVMSITPPTAAEVKRLLRYGGIDELLVNIIYLVYRGHVCYWADPQGKTLMGSIKERVSPEVYALLTKGVTPKPEKR